MKAGDLIAKVDLEFLSQKQINSHTPVLICGGMEGKTLNYHEGSVEAGKSEVLTLTAENAPENQPSGQNSGAASREASNASGGGASSDGREIGRAHV